ncbi:peroxide stress protein YaaA [Mycoplasma sp. P36-A1]|uniref:peroxide stress protein YaaA n=1 Tax=Mycoplasma sp. P36-A1 TaxID=3252900 RepID=UPI003C2C3926
MKVLLSPSKEMNLDDLILKENSINFDEVIDNIKYIKSISKDESCKIFKTKNDIYNMHSQINIYSKYAILLYNGIAFMQIPKNNLEKFKDLYILSSLYGMSNGLDYISPHRFDYTMKGSKTFKKIIYNQINIKLAEEEIVYNLASNEFNNLIEHPNLINFTFICIKDNIEKKISVDNKKLRGIMANNILDGNTNFESFEYLDYKFKNYDVTNKEYIYVKKI